MVTAENTHVADPLYAMVEWRFNFIIASFVLQYNA